MKYIIILIFFITNGCGYGQYPKLKMYRGEIYNANDYTQTQFDSLLNSGVILGWDTSSGVSPDTVYYVYPLTINDTVKVIMQVSDTSRQAWDTKIYWIKGYKVIGDYDTYYLDILKQPLRKTIIVWLDQNIQ